jgi:hypothetical protein
MMKNSNKHPLGVNSNVNCASTDRWLLFFEPRRYSVFMTEIESIVRPFRSFLCVLLTIFTC